MATPPDQNLPLIRLPRLEGRGAVLADTRGTPTPTPTPAPSPAPRWTAEQIKAEWQKTDRGKEVLRDLPATTTFKSYVKAEGDRRNAFYRPSEDAIYIPTSYTSAEAAATAAHEAVHAKQHKDNPSPTKEQRVENEIPAKHTGLDVWEQLGKPTVPYNYASESEARARDRAAYEEAVRRTYRSAYGVPEPTPSPTPTPAASPSPTPGS